MANPTTYFGWVMPNSADLVTDLPADFNVFGQGVDTSMSQLLGGTTGQVLSKTSGTNMAFTWINNDQGDITGVTAGTGISVTSPTGPVPTVAIDATVTTLTGTQTLTNKTLTSPALTTPTISTATTNGDLLYGTGSGALVRLGIGSSAEVLTVAGGVPTWATPASGSTFVGCSVYKVTTNQSIANDTDTTISFNAEEFDTDAFHDNSTNNSRITIPAGKSGKYLIIAAINFAASATGTRAFKVIKNGSTQLLDNHQQAPTPTLTYRGSMTGIAALVATDYIEVQASQLSGGNLDVRAGQVDTRFAAIYLGA